VEKGYGNVRPLSLGDGTFDDYMIHFSVVVSALSFGAKISV
jgi:hypothetical protein